MLLWRDDWTGADPPTRHGEMLATLLERDGPAAGSSMIRRLPARRLTRSEFATASTLAIRGVLPNGSPGAAVIRLTLADATPARVELFDVLGRRRWSRNVGSLGAGDHELRVDDSSLIPAGTYFARLTQGNQRASAAIVVR
jgi:hypothetical protein